MSQDVGHKHRQEKTVNTRAKATGNWIFGMIQKMVTSMFNMALVMELAVSECVS